MYAEAVENSIAVYTINSNDDLVGNYTASKDGKILIQESIQLNVDYNKSKVYCKVIEIYEDSTFYLAECEVDGILVAGYTYGQKKEIPTIKIYPNGQEVYFDIETGKGCTNYNEENSKTNYNGKNPPGNQTSCLKFYAFNDDGSDTLNLLLDHNTTANDVY